MEEILHHLGWLKPVKQWDKPPIWIESLALSLKEPSWWMLH